MNLSRPSSFLSVTTALSKLKSSFTATASPTGTIDSNPGAMLDEQVMSRDRVSRLYCLFSWVDVVSARERMSVLCCCAAAGPLERAGITPAHPAAPVNPSADPPPRNNRGHMNKHHALRNGRSMWRLEPLCCELTMGQLHAECRRCSPYVCQCIVQEARLAVSSRALMIRAFRASEYIS